jgi:hypothetical protein
MKERCTLDFDIKWPQLLSELGPFTIDQTIIIREWFER